MATLNLTFSQIPSSSRILFSRSQTPKNQLFNSINFRNQTLHRHRRRHIFVNSEVVKASSTAGLYSAEQFDLTTENVDKVLDNVRPYLISDGGEVEVVSVDDGVVSLRLLGACGSCPSSTTTMKMGIERVLKEKFGDAVRDIRQVNDQDQVSETTVEAVNGHLDILRPAIQNYGGSVEVLSVEGGNCLVKYVGPESIGSGVKAAIKERFPDITNVEFSTD